MVDDSKLDPLKNLSSLFSNIVIFILTNARIFIIILGVGFLLALALLLNFFKLLGF